LSARGDYFDRAKGLPFALQSKHETNYKMTATWNENLSLYKLA